MIHYNVENDAFVACKGRHVVCTSDLVTEQLQLRPNNRQQLVVLLTCFPESLYSNVGIDRLPGWIHAILKASSPTIADVFWNRASCKFSLGLERGARLHKNRTHNALPDPVRYYYPKLRSP